MAIPRGRACSRTLHDTFAAAVGARRALPAALPSEAGMLPSPRGRARCLLSAWNSSSGLPADDRLRRVGCSCYAAKLSSLRAAATQLAGAECIYTLPCAERGRMDTEEWMESETK